MHTDIGFFQWIVAKRDNSFFLFRSIGRHADDFPPTYDFTIGRSRGRPPARDIVAI